MRNWNGVASSADGTTLVACVWGGQIYTSTDSGATWTARDSSRNWSAVTSSADGSRMVASEYGNNLVGGQIYTSAAVPLSAVSSTIVGTTGYLSGVQGAAIELQYVGNNQFFPISHEGSIVGY